MPVVSPFFAFALPFFAIALKVFDSIKGQVAVITGGAGGIGQALALDITLRGAASIALVDSSDRVVQVQQQLLYALPARFIEKEGDCKQERDIT